MLRQSQLPLEKDLESLEMDRFPTAVSRMFRTLLDGTFLDRKENMLAFGRPGSGKTHLLGALSQELIRRHCRKVLFTKSRLLVQELLIAKRDLKLSRLLKRFSGFEALVIDDLGYVQQSREEMEVLFTLLAERYERGSVLLTSNLPFSKWETIFKDAMTTAAAPLAAIRLDAGSNRQGRRPAGDRMVHHRIILELNIPSYRVESAKQNQQKGNGKTKPPADESRQQSSPTPTE